MQQQRVAKRHRRKAQTLTGRLHFGKVFHRFIKCLEIYRINAPCSAQFCKYLTNFAQNEIRSVAACSKGCLLIRIKPLVGFCLSIIWPKMRHHRLRECNHIVKKLRTRALRTRQLVQHHCLTRKAACHMHKFAPDFARFPPAVVASIVAEAQEDRKRNAKQREGCAIVECRNPARKGAMRPDHDERQYENRKDLWQYPRDNRAFEDEE